MVIVGRVGSSVGIVDGGVRRYSGINSNRKIQLKMKKRKPFFPKIIFSIAFHSTSTLTNIMYRKKHQNKFLPKMWYIKTTYYELYFFSFIKIVSFCRHRQLALLFSQEGTSRTHLKPHKK